MTKSEQLRKNGKIKDQGVKDSKYLSDLHQVGLSCIVCESHHIELHHVYSVIRGVKRSDHVVVPLCTEHHRGSKCSPHGGKEAFYNMFTFGGLLLIAEKIRKNYLER